MRKFLPYQQYDVRAIEEWLNKQSLAGYRLVKMDGVFPTFKKYIDHQYHYRVRYIPEGKVTGYAHYWGKLYIFESQDKTTLPAPSYIKDSELAAQDRRKPFFALALLVALFAVLEAVYSGFAMASPLFLAASAVTAIAEVAWLWLILTDFKRGGDIAKGKVNVDRQPPNPKHKLLTLIVSLVTIFAMVIVAVTVPEAPEKPSTPEACVDAFFAGNYEYRTTQETLDENGNPVKTIIEGKRTNGDIAKEAYKYVECPYTLSWTECYAEEGSNNTTRVKLLMNTGEWVLTSGYLGTPSYHENMVLQGEETVNGVLCEVYTTSYEWAVPENFNLTDEENELLGGSIISLTYWLDKETGLPVKIVTDSGDSPRWMNIAYTYANRYASMMFDMTLEDAIAMYPAEAEYLNVQTFEVLDFGDHIEILDPTAEQ